MPLTGEKPLRISLNHTLWERKFAWRPKICSMTGERIWLRHGYYRIFSTWSDMDLTLITHQSEWITEECYLIEQLKKTEGLGPFRPLPPPSRFSKW